MFLSVHQLCIKLGLENVFKSAVSSPSGKGFPSPTNWHTSAVELLTVVKNSYFTMCFEGPAAQVSVFTAILKALAAGGVRQKFD